MLKPSKYNSCGHFGNSFFIFFRLANRGICADRLRDAAHGDKVATVRRVRGRSWWHGKCIIKEWKEVWRRWQGEPGLSAARRRAVRRRQRGVGRPMPA